MKKILIMGLSNTGKTTLNIELANQLRATGRSVRSINGDQLRADHNDWDFSREGRIRQAERMKEKVTELEGKFDFVIYDLIAPLQEMRDILSSDFTVWMNTEKKSKYPDTDAMFEKPEKPDVTVTEKNAVKVANNILTLVVK